MACRLLPVQFHLPVNLLSSWTRFRIA